jgi:hypothetical protein
MPSAASPSRSRFAGPSIASSEATSVVPGVGICVPSRLSTASERKKCETKSSSPDCPAGLAPDRMDSFRNRQQLTPPRSPSSGYDQDAPGLDRYRRFPIRTIVRNFGRRLMIADFVSLAPVRHRWPYRDIVLDARFLALRCRSTRLPILIHPSLLEGSRWDVSVLVEMRGDVQLQTELGDQGLQR